MKDYGFWILFLIVGLLLTFTGFIYMAIPIIGPLQMIFGLLFACYGGLAIAKKAIDNHELKKGEQNESK